MGSPSPTTCEVRTFAHCPLRSLDVSTQRWVGALQDLAFPLPLPALGLGSSRLEQSIITWFFQYTLQGEKEESQLRGGRETHGWSSPNKPSLPLSTLEEGSAFIAPSQKTLAFPSQS